MTKFSKNEISYDVFPLKAYDKIRYGDTDKQGHVNNAVFSTFLETGQSEMYNFEALIRENKCAVVIASKKIDLIGEITWPGTVEIGTAVKYIGNSSVTLIQGLFQNEVNVAFAEVVLVQIDENTRKAKAFNNALRDSLSEFLIAT